VSRGGQKKEENKMMFEILVGVSIVFQGWLLYLIYNED